MTTYLPKELQEGLEQARQRDLRKKNRLRVESDERSYPILGLEENGFYLASENAPHLRGMVDIYEGARHILQCLIIAFSDEYGRMHYEFKRSTAALDRPPLDFARDEGAPVALIERSAL